MEYMSHHENNSNIHNNNKKKNRFRGGNKIKILSILYTQIHV
jgi:hypothetical protein